MSITLEKRIYREPEIVQVTIDRLEDWIGFSFESSSGLTEEYAAFAKMFVARIKSECKLHNLTLVNHYRGHFEYSGFAKNNRTGKLAYFHISDVRFFPRSWHSDILIRTAQHEKDYSGGRNESATIQNIGERLERITQ